MFPLVPYYNLPRLHEVVKADMPPAYTSLFDAWRELVPAVLRQVKDPSYFVPRPLPTPTLDPSATRPRVLTAKGRVIDGWAEVCVGGFLSREDVIRFDHEGETYAIHRNVDGELFATAGRCTHGNAHLAEGFVKGNQVECPKHNGRFDVRDGSPQRKPACVALRTFPAEERDGKIFVRVVAQPTTGAPGEGRSSESRKSTILVTQSATGN